MGFFGDLFRSKKKKEEIPVIKVTKVPGPPSELEVTRRIMLEIEGIVHTSCVEDWLLNQCRFKEIQAYKDAKNFFPRRHQQPHLIPPQWALVTLSGFVNEFIEARKFFGLQACANADIYRQACEFVKDRMKTS